LNEERKKIHTFTRLQMESAGSATATVGLISSCPWCVEQASGDFLTKTIDVIQLTCFVVSFPIRRPHRLDIMTSLKISRATALQLNIIIVSGTLCGIHTYVGEDDMWDSCDELDISPVRGIGNTHTRLHSYG